MKDQAPLTTEQLQALDARLEVHMPEMLNFLAFAGTALLGLQRIVQAAAPAIDAMVRRAAPHLEALWQIDWANVNAQLERLPARSKDAMKLAAANGWFLGWHESLGDVMQLIEKLESTDEIAIEAAAIDKVFEEYFTQNFDVLKRQLVERYQHRAEAIEAAAHAHNSDAFQGAYVSIPVFIAQADGLLSEIVGIKSVFQQPGRDQLKAQLAQWNTADPEIEGLLEPLTTIDALDLLLNLSQRGQKERDSGQKFTALNRHQVMHGETSDYGTRVNSLKAFSLLAFVGLHVPQVIESAKRNIPAPVGP